MQEKAVESYRQGDNAFFPDEENFPIQNFAKNKDAVWQLLDRATMRLAKNEAKESTQDFTLALDAIDYYRHAIAQELAAQLLIDDKEAAYLAPTYETLLARLMAACAYFQINDLSNAVALLRQAEEVECLEREMGHLSKARANPIGAYLLAAALEREGDSSQARILYEQLGLHEELKQSKSHATLICVTHEGLIPEKTSIIAPLSIISMELLELLLRAWDIQPAISSLSGISIPAFPDNAPYSSAAPLHVDGEIVAYTLTHDIFETARADLSKKISTIATRAAARQLIRRAGVGYAYDQGQILGGIADIGMLFANLATKADTRMWHTLPQKLRLMRVDLEPGLHTIRCGHGEECRIHLKAGDLYVVQLFCPQGRENHILIPTPGKNHET